MYGGKILIMDNEKIQRINELAKKSRTEGLTESEKIEQDTLRKEYIASVRRNFRAQLESIRYVDEPGRTLH